MPSINKPFTFTNGQTADASQVNSDFDTLYTSVDGNLDSANIADGGIQSVDLANEAVTPAKSEGLPYASDLFGNGFIVSGLTCTKDSTNANKLNWTAGTAYMKQADGSLRRLSIASGSATVSAPTSTYYLDVNPDGTYTWGGHSSQANYINVATVTSDGSSNIATVTQNSAGYNVTLLASATGAIGLNNIPNATTNTQPVNLGQINGTAMSNNASSGYQKFPNGMILQWISATVFNVNVTTSTTPPNKVTVNYPIAFPNAALWVTGSLSPYGWWENITDVAFYNDTNNKTYASMSFLANAANASAAIDFWVLAIGY